MPPLFFLLLLLLLHTATRSALSKPGPQEPDFFASCPAASCGSSQLKIRFPLRLRSSPPSCSPNGLDLTCRGNATFLSSFRVTAIDYRYSHVTVDIGPGSPCPLRNLTSLSLSFPATPYYAPAFMAPISLVSCSEQLVPGPSYMRVAGPIRCLSGPGYYVYAVDTSESMDVLHGDCMVVETGGEIPLYALDAEYYDLSFGDMVDSFERRREVILSWDKSIPGISEECRDCEREGRLCGFDQESNQIFCQKGNHGTPVKTIIGASIGGLLTVVLVSALLCFVYISRISIKEKETRLKVERFLATYTTTKPTRYTYSEIKKMTKNFRRKLGQGGFGTVYKGELPNGVPVAVKLLEKSRREVEEFINEVSVFETIHHVNVVGLLGFCAEGSSHALLFEFMPNGSLEKFIFSRASRRFGDDDQPLDMEKLQDIALGVARGIEYLHQGCDRRILHFDIKPHNILLDHNFNPKITDFGLAKLCSRDESMVTMTAARGTMGYIAPEVYSRNFGAVSYKSDVYSFGMVLLEMVTGRKNLDPAIQDQGGVYFPEWLYERLVDGEDLGLGTLEQEEEWIDIAKKLVIVAFWCIQWSPTDRPSMTRVVQLLTGSLENLHIPPKPFTSSSDQDSGVSINVVS